ncbi:hypothetical protein FIV06_15760 [Labrenzia sp. THAF191b]|uniref:hypothetical protein n=1 Tax=unclassified Labrenzia TaxID=2648686 RepID=UPI0012A8330F|nr:MULTISPECIES: hypothetical protein [unclassified Labrenzia]QFS98884.1 hypothetical protein FIV06_15760 [Labrenzia sp. THAF191b]QFT05198.1 hypothetical protein FIV05_15755 [Labrenzia sp. THAF191a]QFT16742.1 hypothetical protein FIV03_15770 [Labrenzia sp. THAF187b]
MDRFKYLDLLRFDTGEGSGAAGGGDVVDPAAGGGADPAAGGAADPAAGGAADPAAGGDAIQLYRPEGLAEHYLGENDQGTIDNMKKALDGYRDRDANVPEDHTAYATFNEENVPETLRPHLGALANDPLFGKVSEKAKELRLPVDTFQTLTTELYTAAQDAGLLEEPLDVEAERAALTPDHAKHLSPQQQQHARERRMNENFGWLDLLAGDEKSGISKDMAEHVKVELGDSALGHAFFEAMRNKIGGGPGPQAGHGGSASQDAHAALLARGAEPKNNPSHRDFDPKSYDQYKADLQAYHA